MSKEAMQMALDVLIDIEMSYECKKEIDALQAALAQPEKEWVGLTDEEIAKAIGAEPDDIYLADFRKVEAKLKEKNTWHHTNAKR